MYQEHNLIRTKSIEEKIEWIWKVNKENSERYIADYAPRNLYKAKHKTSIYALMCMDGRVSLSFATKTPLGIINPYRNLGGKFNNGWFALGEEIQHQMENNLFQGKKTLVLINYHFSQSDPHKGCAGFDYDCDKSIKFEFELHRQFNRIYGENNGVLYPIIVGLETDTDALIFHSQDLENNKTIRLSEETNTDKDYLMSLLNDLYPNMDIDVKNDIIPLMEGNINRIKEVKETGRELKEMVHGEWVLGIGRGFNGLHVPNTALLVSPYHSPDLSVPIIKALGLISGNMKEGKIGDDDHFLIITSALFKQEGYDKNRAKEKSNFFGNVVKSIIEEHFKELISKYKLIQVVVNENTRRMEQFDEIKTGLN